MTIREMKHRFCGRVSEIRLREKMSLEELSRRSGVPLEMLEALERGVLPDEMMMDDTIDLAAVLGCQAHELFQ